MTKIEFHTGQKVDVVFEEASHTYHVAHYFDDNTLTQYRPTHGVTTPLVVVPKEYLKPWAGKKGVLATLERVLDKPQIIDDLPQFFIDLKAKEDDLRDENNKPVMSDYRFRKNYPWYTGLSTAFKLAAGEGQEAGTFIHSAIENYYKSGRKQLPILTPESEPIWGSFIQFDNFFKPTPDADGLEFIVYSLKFGYSGQGDYRGTMSGKTCIGDWKSTNRSKQNADGISVDYFFQLGGLAQAEYERTGVWVDDLFIANFDKKGGEPRVIWASEFGMSPADCARAYISCFMNYHVILDWERKFLKR